MQQNTKQCQNCKNEFVIEPEDFRFYEKIKVPPPTWCPECRLMRRLIWRNERVLYKRNCDLCSNKTISVYPEETLFPVYCAECWRSDKWNALDYGREYDFSQPFFKQFRELFNHVPRPALSQNGNNVNVEYANIVQDAKNVYMSSSAIWGSENVYYSANATASKEVFDCLNVVNSEIQYECINSNKNYDCAHVWWSRSCVSSQFLLDCSDCQNCLGCVGLRNKQYYIFNQPYSKEEYVEKLQELNLGSFRNRAVFQKQFEDFSLTFPRRFARIINCTNSVGDELTNSKNAKYAFIGGELENVKYALRCPAGVKDSMDITHKGHGELVYEHALGGSDPGSNLIGILYGMPGIDHISYSDYCGSASNLFGCIGVRGKSYVILNRLYEKEEYEKLVEKIIAHMKEMPYTDSLGRTYGYGELFPPEFSPFSYNETVANEYFPRSKDEVVSLGFQWKEIPVSRYEITMDAKDLPDDIKEVSDTITMEIIACVATGKAYRILSEELAFYRRIHVPLPRLHPDERHRLRFLKRNPLRLWRRICQCGGVMSEKDIFENTVKHFHGASHCPNEFETSYAPNRPEIVYCEQCYQAEVV